MTQIIKTDNNGDLSSRNSRDDYVRLHVSRFHGLIITAARTYTGEPRREVTAYFGDPQAVADWLAEQGYGCTIPPGQAVRP